MVFGITGRFRDSPLGLQEPSVFEFGKAGLNLSVQGLGLEGIWLGVCYSAWRILDHKWAESKCSLAPLKHAHELYSGVEIKYSRSKEILSQEARSIDQKGLHVPLETEDSRRVWKNRECRCEFVRFCFVGPYS